MEFSAGTVVADRYTIEEPIGEGGMAVVYRVRHNQLDTLHALKVLTFTSRTVKERLLQEGRLQAGLSHPNIVAVTDVVEVDGSPGLVMELIDGPCLDDLVRLQKLTLEQVDVIARGILSAVAHAHAHGLVHRDLKPANVMLDTRAGVVPKVTDFGLAKVVIGEQGRSVTRTGSTMGTPPYMSPEQIRDAKNVDARSDVFACGSILFELLTGERAFESNDMLEVFQRVSTAKYTDPELLRPEAPARMFEAIRGALVVDLEERTQSASELFSQWTGGEALPTVSWDPEQLRSLFEEEEQEEEEELEEPDVGSVSLATGGMVVGGGAFVIGATGLILALVVLVLALMFRSPEIVEVPVQVEVEVPVVAPHPVALRPASVEAVDSDDPELEDSDANGDPWGTEVVPSSPKPPSRAVAPDGVDLPPTPSPMARRNIPRRFRTGGDVARTAALTAAAHEPETTAVLVHYAMNAQNPVIRERAFASLCRQLEKDRGDVALAQAWVEAVLRNPDESGTIREEAIATYAKAGTSTQPLYDFLDTEAEVRHRRAAVLAVGEVAIRLGMASDAHQALGRFSGDPKLKRQVADVRSQLAEYR